MKHLINHPDVQFYQGNCVEVMDALPKESVQMVVCSPPYWSTGNYGNMEWIGGREDCDHSPAIKATRGMGDGGRQYHSYHLKCICGAKQDPRRIGAVLTMDDYIRQMLRVGESVHRILKPDGLWFLNLDDAYDTEGTDLPPGNRCMVPARVAIALQDKTDWIMRQDLIYSKMAPFPESVKNRFTRSHEYIFMLSKRKSGYKFNRIDEEDQERGKLSVWRINHRGFSGGHFGTFPSTLVEPCILSGSDPGDVVFDPFSGSGTTICNALRLGRKGWGVELVEKHARDEAMPNIMNAIGGWV